MNRSLQTLGISLALATSPFTSATWAQDAGSPATDRTLLAYASTKDSVRLPDGRTIHLVCMGHGTPTVILTAGGGDWSISWNRVQPAVSSHTRVCSWDRAAFGFSGPSPIPQTVDNTTNDLEAALKAGGIAGPFIVVGHSTGAYESILLADRQPSAVVGMVLVDPSVPDQTARFDRVTPAQSAWLRARGNPLVDFLETCAVALRAGKVRRDGADPQGCLRAPPWPPNYPPQLRTALDKLSSESSPDAIAAAMETYASYTKLIDLDSKIVVKPDRSYGAMPLIVLTAADFQAPPDYSAAAKAEIPQFHAEWERAHDAYAALSTNGVNRTVASSHDIPQIRPQAVIDAITEVLKDARDSRHR